MKLLAMIQRVIIELLKDKRTLALMFLAPLLVLTLMYFIFNSDEDTTLTIGIDNSVSTQITDSIESNNVKFKDFTSSQHMLLFIKIIKPYMLRTLMKIQVNRLRLNNSFINPFKKIK